MSIGTMLFNPFTGKPRHPADIASDPKGILVWDGEEPLRAAKALPITDLAATPTEDLQDEIDRRNANACVAGGTFWVTVTVEEERSKVGNLHVRLKAPSGSQESAAMFLASIGRDAIVTMLAGVGVDPESRNEKIQPHPSVN